MAAERCFEKCNPNLSEDTMADDHLEVTKSNGCVLDGQVNFSKAWIVDQSFVDEMFSNTNKVGPWCDITANVGQKLQTSSTSSLTKNSCKVTTMEKGLLSVSPTSWPKEAKKPPVSLDRHDPLASTTNEKMGSTFVATTSDTDMSEISGNSPSEEDIEKELREAADSALKTAMECLHAREQKMAAIPKPIIKSAWKPPSPRRRLNMEVTRKVARRQESIANNKENRCILQNNENQVSQGKGFPQVAQYGTLLRPDVSHPGFDYKKALDPAIQNKLRLRNTSSKQRYEDLSKKGMIQNSSISCSHPKECVEGVHHFNTQAGKQLRQEGQIGSNPFGGNDYKVSVNEIMKYGVRVEVERLDPEVVAAPSESKTPRLRLLDTYGPKANLDKDKDEIPKLHYHMSIKPPQSNHEMIMEAIRKAKERYSKRSRKASNAKKQKNKTI